MLSQIDFLDQLTAAGELVQTLENGDVRCLACAHCCLIRPGRRGVCKVRFNQAGTLRVPWGYVAALQVDPIEKKPFFHFYPGSDALTFGMLGCDYHCGYCQNWVTSQALRDPQAEIGLSHVRRTTPEQLAAYARQSGARLVASSYNEPLITSEWAAAVFQQARKAGLHCAYISNGNATAEVLAYLRPYLSAYKIDLKSMRDKNYRSLGGVLQVVLDAIRQVHALGLWLEIVTLVVPGLNDSRAELNDAAQFIASVSPYIPWHVTAFHPDYKLTEPPATSVRMLLNAAEAGAAAGLKFVYAGNLPGYVGEFEHTFCPGCGQRLIERYGYVILDYQITGAGTCPKCATAVPGVWAADPAAVRLHGAGRPRAVGR